MNKANTLKTARTLSPDQVLFSRTGRFKITLLQLVARFLPGRFAVWLSMLRPEPAEGLRPEPAEGLRPELAEGLRPEPAEVLDDRYCAARISVLRPRT